MSNFVTIDFETANSNSHSICQVGIVEFEEAVELHHWSTYVNPLDIFDRRNTLIHGIKSNDVENSPKFIDIYEKIKSSLSEKIVVSHGSFDRTALKRALEKYNLNPFDATWIDSTIIARRVLPQFAQKGYSLQNLAKHYEITTSPHDALDDARTCGLILNRLLQESNKSIEDWVCEINNTSKKNQQSNFRLNAEHIKPNPEGKFYGISICVTGALSFGNRSQVHNYISNLGFTIHNGLKKDTDYLLDGIQTAHNIDASGKSKKEKDFEEKFSKGCKIRLITEDDFMAICEVGTSVFSSVINSSAPSTEFNIEFTEDNIQNLLKNPNIELEFTSPDKRYKIIYTTSIIAKEISDPIDFNRNYYLYDTTNKSVMNSPWDSYEEKNQISIIKNLINIANYSVTRISKGWRIICPKCSNKFEDAIWRNSPRSCIDQDGISGCGQSFLDANKLMLPFIS